MSWRFPHDSRSTQAPGAKPPQLQPFQVPQISTGSTHERRLPDVCGGFRGSMARLGLPSSVVYMEPHLKMLWGKRAIYSETTVWWGFCGVAVADPVRGMIDRRPTSLCGQYISSVAPQTNTI